MTVYSEPGGYSEQPRWNNSYDNSRWRTTCYPTDKRTVLPDYRWPGVFTLPLTTTGATMGVVSTLVAPTYLRSGDFWTPSGQIRYCSNPVAPRSRLQYSSGTFVPQRTPSDSSSSPHTYSLRHTWR